MTINILWTGGLDSTYRVIELTELLPEGSEIQPYYIVDEQRRSTTQELAAIRKITSKVNAKSTKIKINNLIVFPKSQVKENNAITTSYFKFNKKYNLGGQYDWLSRFANQCDINLEVGLELLPNSRTMNTIEGEGKIVCSGEEAYSCFIIDNNASTPDLINVFGRFRFPKTMRGKSKIQEIESLCAWGYDDIILDTWFCHRPVLGKPCGQCNPCKDCIEMGLGWRVPMIGRILGYIRLPKVLIEKVFSKLSKLMK